MGQFSGRSAAGRPVTVQLKPCGTARCRLITPEGTPLDHYPALALLSMVVTPGPIMQARAERTGPLFAEEASVAQLAPVHYGTDFQSDAQGRLTFPALIPGATYRLEDFSPAFNGGDVVVRKEFTIWPGVTLDLGDILIARPQRRNGP